MIWTARGRRRVPFVVVIVLFGVSLAFSFRSLLDQDRAQRISLSDNLWVITQLEIEYLRFLDAFDRFALRPLDSPEREAAQRRDLRQRLDVLWSRIPLLLTGEEGRQFESVPGVQDMARDLERTLRELEPRLLDLSPGDAAAYAALRARLTAPALGIHGAVRASFMADEEEIYTLQVDMRRTYVMLAVSLLGILVSAGALLVLFNRESRAARVAEGRMAEALYRAEAANRAKSEFLAKMSHELRTPLNAILGFAEVLKLEMFGPIENPRYRRYVDDIHQSGSHLLLVIGDILDLAKIEAGKMDLFEEEVDPVEAIDLALRIVRPDGQDRGLSLETSIAPDLPNLRADGQRVRQMILNLLSNAVKFTPMGGRVRVEAGPAPGGRVAIRVVDTGIGMTGEDVKLALQPFQQIASGARLGVTGTGLGLPLVKAFAELHGASMRIESKPSLGTTVTILFPRSRVIGRSGSREAAGFAAASADGLEWAGDGAGQASIPRAGHGPATAVDPEDRDRPARRDARPGT